VQFVIEMVVSTVMLVFL